MRRPSAVHHDASYTLCRAERGPHRGQKDRCRRPPTYNILYSSSATKILLSERDENAQDVRRGQHLLASLKPGGLQRPPPPILGAEDENAVHRVPEYHCQG